MIRKAAFAGHFYPGRRQELEAELRRLVPAESDRRPVVGLVAPHAGYVYSGACAGKAYGRIASASGWWCSACPTAAAASRSWSTATTPGKRRSGKRPWTTTCASN